MSTSRQRLNRNTIKFTGKEDRKNGVDNKIGGKSRKVF